MSQETLQVFIESMEGVTIEDCERVSRQISSVLDTENPLRDAYILEVSSPGIDRYLFELVQYQKYLGKKIKIKLFEPINGQRSFAGKLIAAESTEDIQLEVEGVVVKFSLEKIQVGQVIY